MPPTCKFFLRVECAFASVLSIFFVLISGVPSRIEEDKYREKMLKERENSDSEW